MSAGRSSDAHTPYGPWALLVLAAAVGVGVIAFPTLYITAVGGCA